MKSQTFNTSESPIPPSFHRIPMTTMILRRRMSWVSCRFSYAFKAPPPPPFPYPPSCSIRSRLACCSHEIRSIWPLNCSFPVQKALLPRLGFIFDPRLHQPSGCTEHSRYRESKCWTIILKYIISIFTLWIQIIILYRLKLISLHAHLLS